MTWKTWKSEGIFFANLVGTLGEVGALVLLDMSAAFDTIDHRIMLDVLQQRFDVHDAVLDWFTSYFADRTQVVVSGTTHRLSVNCG